MFLKVKNNITGLELEDIRIPISANVLQETTVPTINDTDTPITIIS